MLAYKISEVCTICKNRQELVKLSANRRVEAGWTPMVSPRYTAKQFHSLWHYPVGGHVVVCIQCVRSHVGCATVRQTCLTNILKMQKRCKWTEFFNKVKFDLDGQAQSVPKTRRTLSKIFCIFGPNLVIQDELSRTCDELSRRQAYDWWRHGHTQATTIPEGQNWPRVKMISMA